MTVNKYHLKLDLKVIFLTKVCICYSSLRPPHSLVSLFVCWDWWRRPAVPYAWERESGGLQGKGLIRVLSLGTA